VNSSVQNLLLLACTKGQGFHQRTDEACQVPHIAKDFLYLKREICVPFKLEMGRENPALAP
jgi:hypothetical protein